MAETANWIDNVGQVFLSNNPEYPDCFWIFPTAIFSNKRLHVTSPWFYYKNDDWRLVKAPGKKNENSISLYLWKNTKRNPSYKYTVKMYFKTLYGKEVGNCTNITSSDFGFEFRNFFHLPHLDESISLCGRTKLFFDIQKESVPEREYTERVFNPLRSITEIDANADSMNCEEPELGKNDESEFKGSTETDENEDSKNDDEPEFEKKDESELKGVDRLLQNLKNLLLDEQTSDVLLKVEDHEFKAHRGILKVRSPVFASMFEPHTKESTDGIVDIPDCSSSVFEAFLLYIYTANANVVSPNNVFDLYYVADKYQIHDLKSECIQFMEKNLSTDNFCEVMTLSLQHGESSLQKVATRFFCDNARTIIKTVQWQKYMKDYSTEANELYIKAIDS